MIDRGAQHKVYAHTNTLQLQAPHICRAHAARHFCGERRPQHADLGARADRVEERRGSRRRYRIDHGEAPLRRRRAQDEPAQGPGGPCRVPPLCRLPPSFETSAALQLERLLRSDSDLDSGVATMCAVATVCQGPGPIGAPCGETRKERGGGGWCVNTGGEATCNMIKRRVA